MIHKTRILLILCLNGLISLPAWAHGEFHLNDGVEARASVVAGYSYIDDDRDTLWQVPGVLMGGEAFGAEPGFAIREASLQFTAASQSGSFATLEAGVHGHSEHHELAIEQALAGWLKRGAFQSFKVEAGVMKPLFAVPLSRHASQSAFIRKPLVYDLFYGGHANDTGVRGQWYLPVSAQSNLTTGLELWKGDAFPATPGDTANAGDLFSYWRWHRDAYSVSLGAWYYFGKSRGRTDDRLTDDHNHSTTTSNLSETLQFSGDNEALGIYAHWRWQFHQNTAFMVSGEYIQMDQTGQLDDENRSARLKGDYDGGWIQVDLQQEAHRYSLRYDRVVLDNLLTGSGAPVLVNSTQLDTDHEPEVLSLAYAWQYDENLILRLEQRFDKSETDRVAETQINLNWREKFDF